MEQKLEVEIVPLADRMDLFDSVSEWLWKQWGDGKSLDYVRYQLRYLAMKDRVPTVFVALVDGKAVGSVSVWSNDLPSRQDLFPWLASLYVTEEARNRGVGSKLQEHAVRAVRKLGYKELYLFTELENYYERLGWKLLDRAPKTNGEMTKVYMRTL